MVLVTAGYSSLNKKRKVAGLNAGLFESDHNRGELKEFWMTGDLKVPGAVDSFRQ